MHQLVLEILIPILSLSSVAADGTGQDKPATPEEQFQTLLQPERCL